LAAAAALLRPPVPSQQAPRPTSFSSWKAPASRAHVRYDVLSPCFLSLSLTRGSKIASNAIPNLPLYSEPTLYKGETKSSSDSPSAGHATASSTSAVPHALHHCHVTPPAPLCCPHHGLLHHLRHPTALRPLGRRCNTPHNLLRPLGRGLDLPIQMILSRYVKTLFSLVHRPFFNIHQCSAQPPPVLPNGVRPLTTFKPTSTSPRAATLFCVPALTVFAACAKHFKSIQDQYCNLHFESLIE
jgi:hypothetical protein